MMGHGSGKLVGLAILAMTLVACATNRSAVVSHGGVPPMRPSEPEPIPNPVYKVGNPYQIAGVWYYPQEQPAYDETGIASWYGTEFSGRLTADGELFDRTAISGAHPTLPMPSNVRVTNLENGKSIVVRVNDRGPYVNGRIIDLSERGADLLGYRGKGTARVRVTYIGRADLNGPGPAPPAQDTPLEVATAVSAAPTQLIAASTLPPIAGVPMAPAGSIASTPKAVPQPSTITRTEIPDGRVTQLPVPMATAIYVQAGAFSSPTNAGSVATKLYGLGARVMPGTKDGRPIYRVRIGPFQDVGSADAVLAQVQALGHADVQIVVDTVAG
jgi:rare lipoprotein A